MEKPKSPWALNPEDEQEVDAILEQEEIEKQKADEKEKFLNITFADLKNHVIKLISEENITSFEVTEPSEIVIWVKSPELAKAYASELNEVINHLNNLLTNKQIIQKFELKTDDDIIQIYLNT